MMGNVRRLGAVQPFNHERCTEDIDRLRWLDVAYAHSGSTRGVLNPRGPRRMPHEGARPCQVFLQLRLRRIRLPANGSSSR